MTAKKRKIVSRMSVGPNTSKLRRRTSHCATHTLGPAGPSTVNKRHIVSKLNYKDGTSCGNAAQAIGGARIRLPQEKYLLTPADTTRICM